MTWVGISNTNGNAVARGRGGFGECETSVIWGIGTGLLSMVACSGHASMIKGCPAQNGSTALIEKLVFSFYLGLKIGGEMYLWFSIQV